LPGFASYIVPANVGVQPVTFISGDIKLIPNPNKGAFSLKGTLGVQADEDVHIEITDMLGQVVYSKSVVARNGQLDEHIDLSSSLPNGMYMLNMHTSVGNKIFHMVIEQ
jgi:hypothetical protein